MANDLESIAIFSENWRKIVCVIDEKFYVIELVAPM
jgi:hypothetical protein